MNAFIHNETMYFSNEENARPLENCLLFEHHPDEVVVTKHIKRCPKVQNVSKLELFVFGNFGTEASKFHTMRASAYALLARRLRGALLKAAEHYKDPKNKRGDLY